MAKTPSSEKILEDFLKLSLPEQINLFKAIKLALDNKKESASQELKSLQEIENKNA